MNSRLLLAFALLAAAPARAQEYGRGVIGFLGVDGNRLEDAAFVMPGRADAPSVAREELRGTAVVARGADDRWTVDGRAGKVALGAAPVILPGGVVVPRKLWNAQAGAGYARELGDRRRWGASASLGSASDVPFGSFGEVSGLVSAYYQKPSGERASWIFMLNYSNNRPFLNNVPLPGAAYFTRSADGRLTAAFGFPFVFARWRPDRSWTLTARAFGFGSSYGLEAERRVRGPVSAYASVGREPLQWLRSGRAAASDRLVFDSSDARAGARAARGPASLDVSFGRAFRRSFSEGRSSSGVPSSRARLPDAWLAALRASWRWGKDVP